MADLRLFSYLPNPRIYKATVTARLCDVDVEVRGAKPRELVDWLWDVDARPLTPEDKAPGSPTLREARTGFSGALHKTDAFLEAHPFGTVPAAFSPDGTVGIFESNSIARAVARLSKNDHPIYGRDAYEASRIDSFLDVSLVFARDTQKYLLALVGKSISPDLHTETGKSVDTYIGGIEKAIENRSFLVGDALSLADVCFAAEMVEFALSHYNRAVLEGVGLAPLFDESLKDRFPGAMAHLDRCLVHETFAPDLGAHYAQILARSETGSLSA
jgi:glutathione S-transferase